MKSVKVLLILFLLCFASDVASQDESLTISKVESLEREMDYIFVHFTESRRRVGVNITYPDGRREYDSKRYKRKALNDLGDYGWLMNHLNKFIDQGYMLKSHTMTVPFNEDADTYYHVYILEKPVFKKFKY